MAWFGVPALTVFAVSMLWRKKIALPQRILSVFTVLAIGTVLFVWLQWFHNPLPSDETLIKHFNEHRAEFEQLVQGVRNYRRQDVFYNNSAEGKELAGKLRIGQIKVGGFWYPDPYSERIARLKVQYRGGHTYEGMEKNKRTLHEMVDFWKVNMPEMFAGMVTVTEPWQMEYLTGVVDFGIGTNGNGGFLENSVLRLATFPNPIAKKYWHFPQPPRVKNGWLLAPRCYLPDCPGLDKYSKERLDKYFDVDGNVVTHKDYRVFDSLDDYPPAWKRGECVLRRIDPHWFIAMCQAAL